jgi:hypothetical protein
MGDLDTAAWIDAAQTYDRLRRRICRLSFGYRAISVGFAIGFCCAAASNLNGIAGTLFVRFVPASGIFTVVGLIAWFELHEFRCPRCGERFNVSRWTKYHWNSSGSAGPVAALAVCSRWSACSVIVSQKPEELR